MRKCDWQTSANRTSRGPHRGIRQSFPNWPSRDRLSPLIHCAIVPQLDSNAIVLMH
ncbi:hypothetical protein [Altericista sp. CCNU0014]|uniref:hypothetical protein n=1 Tax=Altericista sp. CCNU0014 TaxID=3082949 RepID=UPI00384C2BD9